jgi:hypothetical protein
MIQSANLAAWPADVRDTCGNVFGKALRAAQPTLKADARVLEIGCAEFNWLKPAMAAWPEMTFTGIDWRDTRKLQDRATRIQGDVMTHYFPPLSFDWVVGVSSIEHIGLGHYRADPQNEEGDRIAMENAGYWLTSGGWMYLDVPWLPGEGRYHVHRTSHRVYDDEAIHQRLMVNGFTVKWSGVYGINGAEVTDIKPLKGGESFYYRAYWLQKG